MRFHSTAYCVLSLTHCGVTKLATPTLFLSYRDYGTLSSTTSIADACLSELDLNGLDACAPYYVLSIWNPHNTPLTAPLCFFSELASDYWSSNRALYLYLYLSSHSLFSSLIVCCTCLFSSWIYSLVCFHTYISWGKLKKKRSSRYRAGQIQTRRRSN